MPCAHFSNLPSAPQADKARNIGMAYPLRPGTPDASCVRTFAKAPLPAALLIHGTADTTVYPRNSTNLAAAWRAAGAPVDLKLYPDVGHIDVVVALSGLLSGRAPTRADVLAWLDRA